MVPLRGVWHAGAGSTSVWTEGHPSDSGSQEGQSPQPPQEACSSEAGASCRMCKDSFQKTEGGHQVKPDWII